MRYGYDVSCNETILEKWTPTAIDCYKNGCSCSRCFLYKTYFSKSKIECKMKKNVFELVKKYGVPNYEKAESV